MKDYGLFALMASGLLHIFILVSFSWFLAMQPRPSRKSEIIRDISQMKVIPRVVEISRDVSSALATDPSIPPPFIPDMATTLDTGYHQATSLVIPKPMEEKISEVVVAHEGIDATLRKVPGYMHYYQAIAAKLDRAARKLYDGRDTGIVTVSFIVLPDGRLQSVTLEQGSVANDRLRSIALKTIHDAAPFPSFPEELKNRGDLQFTIPINFKGN